MSEYTREEILKMIEEVGGPQNLDLSGKDLSGIDLSREAIAKELEEYRKNNPDQIPLWFGEKGLGFDRLDLNGAILKKAHLSRSHLDGAVLVEVPFLHGPTLIGINLSGAHLERAILDDAHLDGAKLWGTHLEGASLHRAHFEGAELWGAHLEEAHLIGARLEGAELWVAHLEGASLLAANLEGASLVQAHLKGAFLVETHFEGARLDWAHLERVDLSRAASLARVYFYGAWLDQTRMTKDQLSGCIGEEIDEKYYEAKEAYLLLKNNFNQIGRYDDASWAYVKERQMEKMTYHPKLARTYYAKIERLPEGASPKSWTWWRFYVKYTLKWFWDWIIEWSSGYGERPQNVLAVASVVLVIIFPLLYLLTGLAPRSGQNLLSRDYFLYSLYSFASMEHPTLQATCWVAQLFTGLESLSGIALLALLMYTLGRRISRS